MGWKREPATGSHPDASSFETDSTIYTGRVRCIIVLRVDFVARPRTTKAAQRLREAKLKTHVDRSDSDRAVQRQFCPVCGSSILSENEVDPGIAILRAGTLDDTSGIPPL
jgi:hypothetical protein